MPDEKIGFMGIASGLDVWHYISQKAQQFGRVRPYELAAAVKLHFGLTDADAIKMVNEWLVINGESSQDREL